ncbi:Homeodomain-like domain protein [Leptospira santarosai]|nr:Homeodomain-like domain protein [Leptospira santarosai]
MRSLIVVKRNRFGKQFFKAFERICTVRNQIFIFNNTVNSLCEWVLINIIRSGVLKRVHTCQLQELFGMILPATVRMENDTCNLML